MNDDIKEALEQWRSQGPDPEEYIKNGDTDLNQFDKDYDEWEKENPYPKY